MRILWINLLQAVRSMRKHGWQTLLSLLGLVVGLACFTFSANWLWYETHYDSFRPDSDKLYAVCHYFEDENRYNFCTPLPLADWVKDSVPEATCVSTFDWPYFPPMRSDNGPVSGLEPREVHPDYLKMAGLRFLHGNAETALSAFNSIVISRSRAMKWFGRTDVVGETFYPANEGKGNTLLVTGVFEDDLLRTNFRAHAFMNTDKTLSDRYTWHTNSPWTIIKTDRPDAVNRRLAAKRMRIYPLSKAHVMGWQKDSWRSLMRPLQFSVTSLLLLLSAVFSYISVLVSYWIGRRREYMLRLSLGATFRSNLLWLYAEVCIMALVAVFLASVGVEFISQQATIPYINETVYATFLWVSAGFVGMMLLGALYPLAYIHRMSRRHRTGGLVRDGRMILLAVQVAVCALLLFLFVNMFRQYALMALSGKGFREERVLRVPTRADMYENQLGSIMQDLKQRGGTSIEDVIVLSSSIFQSGNYGGGLLYNEKNPRENMQYDCFELLPKAFDFFGIEPQEGEVYTQAEVNGIPQVMVNKALVENCPFQQIKPGTILSTASHGQVQVCGIVDIHTRALSDGRSHQCIYLYTDDETGGWRHEVMFLRYREGCREQAVSLLKNVLRDHQVPDVEMDISEFDEFIRSLYTKEKEELKLFSLFTVTGIVIVLFGVFSLLTFILSVRRRGIAIRRVFGASEALLYRTYLRSYTVLTVLSCVAVAPLAYYLIDLWLSTFARTVEVGWWPLAAITLLLAVLVASVVALCMRAILREQPSEVLKGD